MSTFEKICAVPAFALAVVFVVLGAIGLFVGCNANFTLSPGLGVIPAFIGWGIIVAIRKSWSSKKDAPPIGFTCPSCNTETCSSAIGKYLCTNCDIEFEVL